MDGELFPDLAGFASTSHASFAIDPALAGSSHAALGGSSDEDEDEESWDEDGDQSFDEDDETDAEEELANAATGQKRPRAPGVGGTVEQLEEGKGKARDVWPTGEHEDGGEDAEEIGSVVT